MNGGGLRIPASSPLNGGAGEVLLQDIRDARTLKGINTVALYVHAPCGAAGLAGLPLEQVLEMLMAAKLRIKQECGEGVRVACFVHVDWGGDRKRTYFISRATWEAWCARGGATSATPGDASAAPA